jgi:hypothetical protein
MHPQLARIVEQIKRRRATERGSVDIVLAKAGNPSYAVCVARTVPEAGIAAAVAEQLEKIQ